MPPLWMRQSCRVWDQDGAAASGHIEAVEEPMTAQIADSCRYLSLRFAVAGANGEGMFDPAEHGLSPRAPHSACWRGFWCEYVVEEGRLLLDVLHIALGNAFGRGSDPPLFGVLPRRSEEPSDRPSMDAAFSTFESLRAPVAFTGGLLIGHGFIDDLYAHMGFHPAWKFRRVHELIFEGGQLLEAFDRSDAAEGFRERLTSEDVQPRGRDSREIRDWVERSFSLHYDPFW
jgi:hypothetical protein